MAIQQLQFDLSDEAYHEFETLRANLNLKTNGELFTAAIRYLQWTLEHVNAGQEILLEKENGVLLKVVLPYFPLKD